MLKEKKVELVNTKKYRMKSTIQSYDIRDNKEYYGVLEMEKTLKGLNNSTKKGISLSDKTDLLRSQTKYRGTGARSLNTSMRSNRSNRSGPYSSPSQKQPQGQARAPPETDESNEGEIDGTVSMDIGTESSIGDMKIDTDRKDVPSLVFGKK